MHCDNCGAEILSGHRFCRSCGRPTDEFAEEGTPTQMMPPEPPTRGPRDTATTSPGRGETNRVYAPPEPNYYQQPYAPIQPPQQMPYYMQQPPPPRSRSPWGWIIAVLALFLIGAVGIAALVFSNANDRGRPVAQEPDKPPPPPPPPGPNESVWGAGTTNEVRSFPFARGGNLTLKTIKGNVTIESWDEPRAEVRVTKGTNAEVRVTSDGNGLSLRTEPRGGGVEVEYEIKLPRNVGRIEIESASADITLSDLTGGVQVNNGSGQVTLSDMNGKIKVNTGSGEITFADVQGELEANTGNGTIVMTDVNGKINANAGNGDISVTFGGASREPLAINTASGDIEVMFDSDVNADLSVTTLTGDIQLDESFGITVQKKQPVGTEARGRIGSGGQTIKIATMAGDVRIHKQ